MGSNLNIQHFFLYTKMKLTKTKNNHYLLVELNARDEKYLDGFRLSLKML